MGRKAKLETDSPLEDSKTIPEFEKPLVSVSVNNPFKKILYWLDQVRRHQTTTFVLKLSIPLIALPVIILGVFSLGKAYGVNFQKSQTPSPSPVVSPSNPASPVTLISKVGNIKTARSGAKVTYLITLKNGETWILEVPENFNLTNYVGKQVLVTGTYNKEANTFSLVDIAEVDVFNSKEIPPTESTSSSL